MVTETADPFYVTDVVVVKQHASWAKFELDDLAMAEYMARMFKDGIMPDQCRHILGHTHPGNDAIPSNMDWENFDEAFEGMDWHIMFIRAKGGSMTCRLRLRTLASRHVDSNQTLIWLDADMEVVVDTKQRRAPRHHLEQWGDEIYDLPINDWAKEARLLCTPFPVTTYATSAGYYYGSRQDGSVVAGGPANGQVGQGQAQDQDQDQAQGQGQGQGQEGSDTRPGVKLNLAAQRVKVLLAKDDSIQPNWERISARYDLTAQEQATRLTDLVLDYESDPEMAAHEIEIWELCLRTEAFGGE